MQLAFVGKRGGNRLWMCFLNYRDDLRIVFWSTTARTYCGNAQFCTLSPECASLKRFGRFCSEMWQHRLGWMSEGARNSRAIAASRGQNYHFVIWLGVRSLWVIQYAIAQIRNCNLCYGGWVWIRMCSFMSRDSTCVSWMGVETIPHQAGWNAHHDAQSMMCRLLYTWITENPSSESSWHLMSSGTYGAWRKIIR